MQLRGRAQSCLRIAPSIEYSSLHAGTCVPTAPMGGSIRAPIKERRMDVMRFTVTKALSMVLVLSVASISAEPIMPRPLLTTAAALPAQATAQLRQPDVIFVPTPQE